MSNDVEVPFGPTGQVVYDRTYSRTMADGSKETWPDTVARVVEGNMRLVYKNDEDWTEDVQEERDLLLDYMGDFRIIPAGRHLWASGVKGRQYLFNCHVSGWGETLSRHFEFTFLRLMEGGGVGSNYSSKLVAKFGLPMRELDVHIVCDSDHPDYEELRPYLSDSYDSDWDGSFAVEDSREGWAAALVDLLDTYMTGDEVKHRARVYDVSRVRGRGSRLKTFGGSASGPAPFARMMVEVGRVMNTALARSGEDFGADHLSPVDCMEIDHAIAECVVSGGNRRSARMSICHWADPYIFEFLACKQDSGKHWTTNISVEIDDEFIDALECIKDFEGNSCSCTVCHARNVHHAVVTGMLTNGEPGYWNSDLSNVGEPNLVTATNPCVSSRTWIATDRGPKRVADLVGIPFTALLDGKPFDSDERGFYKTGTKPVFRITTREGFELECTSNQELYRPDGTRVEVSELKQGDSLSIVDQWGSSWDGPGTAAEGYALGHLVGDGTFAPDGTALLCSWPNRGNEDCEGYLQETLSTLPGRRDWKGWQASNGHCIRMSRRGFTDLARTYGIVRKNKTVTEAVERSSSVFHQAFLRGLFDTDGHVEGNTVSGFSVRLSSIDMPALRAVQRMLARLGIKSSIRPMHAACSKSMPGGVYDCAASYRLVVSGRVFVQRWAEAVGFLNTQKAARLAGALSSYTREPYAPRMFVHFDSAEKVGVEDVYDCTIPGPLDFDGNGFRVRDCGEIALEAWENCNLGHVNLSRFAGSSQDEVVVAHVLMTRFLIRATYGDVNDAEQAVKLARNRRIGVGHFGVQGLLAQLGTRYSEAPDDARFTEFLAGLRDIVRAAADDYAFTLRIPTPVKVTTVAPTGTIAKMPGATEGIHPIYSRYFIRRVRFSIADPEQRETVLRLQSEGYKVEEDVYDASGNTVVVEFPTKDMLVEQVEAEGFPAEIVESADEISLVGMLRFQVMYQRYWADNAVSFTVNVPAEPHQEAAMLAGEATIPPPSPERLQSVSEALIAALPGLKGTTLMLDGARPQAPYERISREQYEAALVKVVADGIDEECANGACPIR